MLWDEFYGQLSVRAQKALTRRGVNSFRELEKMDEYELGLIPGCGKTTASEIGQCLHADGRLFDRERPVDQEDKLRDATGLFDIATETIREARELRASFERVRLALPIRDMFAAAALHARLMEYWGNPDDGTDYESMCHVACTIADAMMAARSKKSGA
jgi:hypothetical protein